MVTHVTPGPKIKELVRDDNDRPSGMREYFGEKPEKPGAQILCGEKTFDAHWTFGYLRTAAGKAQLQTLLAVNLPPLLDRLYGGRLDATRVQFAQDIVCEILSRVDNDLFPAAVSLVLPSETPLSIATCVREVVDANTAKAMQRAATLAVASFLGKLERFGNASPAAMTVPNPAEHHQQIAEQFAQHAAGG